MTTILYFAGNCWVRTEVWDEALSWWHSQDCSHQVRGDIFENIHEVVEKRRRRTRNSHFDLLGPVLRAATPTV
jgi:hypothetical protein